MFDEEFYDYDIKDQNGKRLGHDVDSDLRSLSKFIGFDIQDILYQMREKGELTKTVSITLRRYPEDEAVDSKEA